MEYQKTAKTTGGLVGNQVTNKIMRVSKNLQQNNSETLTNVNGQEIPKRRYTSPE